MGYFFTIMRQCCFVTINSEAAAILVHVVRRLRFVYDLRVVHNILQICKMIINNKTIQHHGLPWF
jgi:hypothetical protein